jgi:hypothetical protein
VQLVFRERSELPFLKASIMQLDQATLDDIIRDLNFKRSKLSQSKATLTMAQLLKLERDVVRLELELFQALGHKYFDQQLTGVTDEALSTAVEKSRYFDSVSHPSRVAADK